MGRVTTTRYQIAPTSIQVHGSLDPPLGPLPPSTPGSVPFMSSIDRLPNNPIRSSRRPSECPPPPFSHALEACGGSARPQKYPPRFAGLPSTGVLLFISLRSTLPRQYLRVSTSTHSMPSVSDNYPRAAHRVSSAEPQMNVAFSLWPTRSNGQHRRAWPALGPGNFAS